MVRISHTPHLRLKHTLHELFKMLDEKKLKFIACHQVNLLNGHSSNKSIKNYHALLNHKSSIYRNIYFDSTNCCHGPDDDSLINFIKYAPQLSNYKTDSQSISYRQLCFSVEITHKASLEVGDLAWNL